MSAGVHGDLLHDLGRRLAAGDIPPGTVFTLADLETQYDASRTAVREAVRVLESINMLQSRRRVGITVLPREEWDAFDPQLITWNLAGPFRQQQLEDLMELRVGVEPLAARLAARRATPTQRADLLRQAETLLRLGRQGLGASQEFLDADLAFHGQLLAASGNAHLLALRTPVHEVLRGRVNLGLAPAVPVEGTLEDHVLVAQAIIAGDGDAAERHSRAHMQIVWGEIARPTP
ncbi:FCD domain-containing protein [Propioniciclava sp.]|uniref:FadR/GntR family transcriptional regulator n=1 Tax=Propioniciclava sp. TaxID=2038686 RepID=UPI002616F1E8|nr:FCD domain-containing protein [Propioniciclava sp.]